MQKSKSWKEEELEVVFHSLAEALPKLAETLIAKKGLPVPVSFSPQRIKQAYEQILQRHLMFTQFLLKRKDKQKGTGDSSDSGESSDKEDGGSGGSSKSGKEEKKALKAVTKEVEESLRIGKDSYSEEHLYECERLLVEYNAWQNPEDGSEQKATCPRSVRAFMQRHLAVAQAPIMSAYEQSHVKGNKKEAKHVTFLLNRMGYLASKISKERLARAGKELNRHGRICKGAELSAKERKESIEGEKKWAGEVRWLSVLIGKGITAYRKYDNGKKSQASQAHLHSAGVLPATSCKAVAASVASCEPGSSDHRGRSRSRSRSHGRRNRRGRWQKGRYPYRGRDHRDRSRDKQREREREEEKKREQRKKEKCWHCGEKGHVVMNCPSAKAGKPPAKGSRFAATRDKDKKE